MRTLIAITASLLFLTTITANAQLTNGTSTPIVTEQRGEDLYTVTATCGAIDIVYRDATDFEGNLTGGYFLDYRVHGTGKKISKLVSHGDDDVSDITILRHNDTAYYLSKRNQAALYPALSQAYSALLSWSQTGSQTTVEIHGCLHELANTVNALHDSAFITPISNDALAAALSWINLDFLDDDK